MTMTKEQLDYVQSQAEKNMDFHLKNLEGLNGEVYKLLTLLFAVTAASFAATVKAYDAQSWILVCSLGALCAYLIVIALMLLGSVQPSDLHAPGNEPKNLLPLMTEPKYTLEQVRESEALNLQERIDLNRSRCKTTGRTIIIVQYAFLASPLVVVAAAVIGVIVQSML